MNSKVLLVLMACSMAFAETGAELFQKAVVQERAAGNLEEAIKIYQRVAREYPKDRALVAKALVQAARCYEKLGQDKAVGLYEQVAREFGDQRESAAAARERLAALGSVAQAKAGARMVARQIPIPPAVLMAHSDGRHVFYVDYEAGGLMAAAMSGTGAHVILPLPKNRERGISGGVSVSPDGRQIAFTLGTLDRTSFCVVGVDGTGFRELHVMPRRGARPIGGWSPDGTHFIGHIIENGSHTVASISALDGSITKIKTDMDLEGDWVMIVGAGGSFSPDGKFVMFGVSEGNGPRSSVHIAAMDGSYQGKLVDHPSANRPLDFTPDGKHILFQSDRSGTSAIYALAISDGRAQGEPLRIKQESGMFTGTVRLSRDGTLFYSLGQQSQREIFTVNLDAHGTVTSSPQVIFGPSGMTLESGAWSPDGQKLAYLSGRNHHHGEGDVALTERTLVSGKQVEWKMPAEREAIVGWAQDGSAIYTASQVGSPETELRMELHAVSATTGAAKRLVSIRDAEVIYSVVSSPDGNSLLIGYGKQPPRTGRPAGVIRLDLKTGEETELIPRGVVSEAVISPDGSMVAALDRQPNGATILVKPLTGGEWKSLATVEGTLYMYLHWLPGGALVFGKEGFPNSTLFRIPLTGGTPEKIGELPSLNHVHEIRVHPNGRQVMFQSYVTRTELWALENFLPKEFLGR